MKAAIVGCGNIAKVHAVCVKGMKEHELVAFADYKIERASQYAEEYGGRYYSSLEEMIRNETIDVLHICTPHYLHTPMAIYGIEHNVHVLMEKPPVISYEQFELLKKASNRKQLGFCFQNRYNPSIKKVKEILNSDITGKILGAKGIVTWNRPDEYYSFSDWRGRIETEGGGVLINQSIHTLDLINYLVNKNPISIDAFMTNHHLKDKIEVEDSMSAYITYDGVIACFYATNSYIADTPPLIEIQCENVRIRIEEQEVTHYHRHGKIERFSMEKQSALGKQYWGSGHRDCIADFYSCIEENRRFLLNIEGIHDTICLMLGAYESCRSGKLVWLNSLN